MYRRYVHVISPSGFAVLMRDLPAEEHVESVVVSRYTVAKRLGADMLQVDSLIADEYTVTVRYESA